MAVTDFETKVALVVRDDLAVWQRLNVCAFLISGVAAAGGSEAIGEPYEDADGSTYLPLLVQPVVVLEANRAAVKVVAGAELDLVGIALRAPHRDADAVIRGLARHP